MNYAILGGVNIESDASRGRSRMRKVGISAVYTFRLNEL